MKHLFPEPLGQGQCPKECQGGISQEVKHPWCGHMLVPEAAWATSLWWVAIVPGLQGMTQR
jgi:hypothetical protein